MATNRGPLARRQLAHRSKADENAMSKHLRQPSGGPAASRLKDNTLKPTAGRQALGEVTIIAVNRKDATNKLAGGKEKEEPSLKRSRSNSTAFAVQRVPLGPGRGQAAPPVANAINARAPPSRIRIPGRVARAPVVDHAPLLEETESGDEAEQMDIEEDLAAQERQQQIDANLNAQEDVKPMDGIEDSDEEEVETKVPVAKSPRVWPEVATEKAKKIRQELQEVRNTFEERVDVDDTTMVSEYAEDIFEYMEELEESVMPNPHYMDSQNEINWGMRQTLVDWLLQVHLRYHMLPETLWIAVNIVDRFLTKRIVSLVKLQLVGVTAMFIAAKYEEILAPSVDEFVFMTENGYTKEEILKGERIMLQALDFRVSHYCSPYSWMRKISKADDYDIQTRTLGKFLTEVTLLDYRFLRVKPSLVAAVGMYCARRMLGGDWNEAFIFHSGFTEEQLLPGHALLVDKLVEQNFSKQYVYKKYANKKFLKASVFAQDWAKLHISSSSEPMKLEA